MNKLLIGFVIAALLVGGFFLFNNYIYEEKQSEVKRETISGTILSVNLEPVTYDGPAEITIRTDTGETRLIQVPSMGLPLCEAFENITDVYQLVSGDRVEVTGDVVAETGAIVPCNSVEHYLHATATFTDPMLGLAFDFRRGPNGYVMQTAPHGNEEEAEVEELFILMLKTDYDLLQTLEGTEGPPTITIAVYRNTKNQNPVVWANANAYASNVELATGAPEETVVGGAHAVRYTVDGLYRADTLVIADDGFIFVVAGAYLDEESTIRKDFEPLLDSMRFIKRPNEE